MWWTINVLSHYRRLYRLGVYSLCIIRIVFTIFFFFHSLDIYIICNANGSCINLKYNPYRQLIFMFTFSRLANGQISIEYRAQIFISHRDLYRLPEIHTMHHPIDDFVVVSLFFFLLLILLLLFIWKRFYKYHCFEIKQ